jgi:hypothetical protein
MRTNTLQVSIKVFVLKLPNFMFFFKIGRSDFYYDGLGRG